MKKESIIFSLLAFIIIVTTILAFVLYEDKQYIYLDKCERLVPETVFIGTNTPYYLVYKDCEKKPQSYTIKNYVFMEK